MESVWLNMRDPKFWKFIMIVGGIIVTFNTIRLIVVACKVRKAEAYLYHGAEAFDGMAVGCGFIAIGVFVCEMPVVGIIAAIFAFIFFCCDRKYRWIYYALPRQGGSFHVCESENSTNQSQQIQKGETMNVPINFAGFTLYRIYYGDCLVYIGRTTQPLQNRIRGHLFKKPMHREIDINQVAKIEYAQFETMCDMYVYEIYFINLWKPPLNRDDKALDYLTVELPDVEWKLFETHLWDKWKQEIAAIDQEEEKQRREMIEEFERKQELRRKWRAGEITKEEYFKQTEGDAWI